MENSPHLDFGKMFASTQSKSIRMSPKTLDGLQNKFLAQPVCQIPARAIFQEDTVNDTYV